MNCYINWKHKTEDWRTFFTENLVLDFHINYYQGNCLPGKYHRESYSLPYHPFSKSNWKEVFINARETFIFSTATWLLQGQLWTVAKIFFLIDVNHSILT